MIGGPPGDGVAQPGQGAPIGGNAATLELAQRLGIRHNRPGGPRQTARRHAIGATQSALPITASPGAGRLSLQSTAEFVLQQGGRAALHSPAAKYAYLRMQLRRIPGTP